VPAPRSRLPIVLLWLVPFLFVLLYAVVINTYYGHESRWAATGFWLITGELFGWTALFSGLWFAFGYAANLGLGELVPIGVLKLITRIPGIDRQVVIEPPTRPDSAFEVWGRFGIMFLFTLGIDLIFLVVVFHRGDVDPRLAVSHPIRILFDEALVGVLLAVTFAPAAPFLASRVRLRITDSLPFPLLWLAALLLVLGGTTILLVEVFPGVVLDPTLFLISILLYAPAAWYVSLAYSYGETRAQQRFLTHAWGRRTSTFHFGQLRIRDEPEGTETRA
jgi:hypothetical protein